jgi:hypothetical protein
MEEDFAPKEKYYKLFYSRVYKMLIVINLLLSPPPHGGGLVSERKFFLNYFILVS